MAVHSSDREGGVQISEEDGAEKCLTETSNIQDASISKQKDTGKGGRKCVPMCVSDNTEVKRERRANERRGWRE
jgi:hypothetical protein